MTKEEQDIHFQEFVEEMLTVITSKQADYATNEDCLNNFKVAGANCGLTAEQQCLSLIATKVARLGVLLKSPNPKHESIRDSVLDMANYSVKLDQLLSEKE